MKRRIFCKVLLVVVAVFGLLVLSGVLMAQGRRGRSEDAFEHVRKAQKKHTDRLMAMDDVEGTAIGFDQSGQLAVKVFTARHGVAGIDKKLDDVPVHVVVTGKIYALPKGRKSGKRPKPNTESSDNPFWYERPVPIGVSTGNVGQCSAGTIACRVYDDGGKVYALSNNHVYALENTASFGSEVLQPGRVDAVPQCAIYPGDVIGTLADFEPIVFSWRASNEIDAAIAEIIIDKVDGVDTPRVGNATPADGYETPSSDIVIVTTGDLPLPVQKYGRNGHTYGNVTGINATVYVRYSRRTARFVNQIIIEPGDFSAAGDSGSLIVTDDEACNPVGLLFAGSSTLTVANPIGLVLERFNVAVDDSTAGEPLELVSIAVTPATASIPKGLTQQYSATGTYSDDSTADITTSATWTSSNELVATIESPGVAKGIGEGTSTITATLDGKQGSATLTVTAPILVSIAVTPETASIEIESTQEYTAIGTYSDGSTADITTSVTWTSSNELVATIDNVIDPGLATAVAEGTTYITASLDSVPSNEATLKVTPPPPTLQSIAVTPVDASIPVGSNQQYTAIGTYSDESTADITNDVAWASSKTSVATIDESGLATAKAEGTSNITAGLDGVEGSSTLTVTEAPSEVQVFSDSFESSADWTAKWSQDSQNDWRRRTSRKKEGNYAAEVDGRATDAQLISIPIDLQEKENATITFWWYIERGLDTGEYLAFDVSTNGGTNWTQMAKLSGNVDPENTWHNVSIDVTTENNLRIRFRGTMSSSREDAYVDVVKVVAR